VAHCLVFTSDSSTLIAGSQSGGLAAGPSEVYSWDVGTGKPARSWTDNPVLGSMVAVSPNGKVLATMNGAGLIRLWDRATGKDMLPRPEGLSALRGACFRPDGKTILTVDDDLAVREWDAASGRSLGPALPKAKDGAKRFLAGGKFLIGESAEKLWLQDAATGKVLLEAIGALCALAPDGKRLAMSDQQGRTSIYDIESATVVRTLSPDGNEPKPAEGKKSRILRSAVGFSADGKSLVSYQGDIVSVWDVNAGTRQSSWSLKENKVLEASDSVSFFAVSADGATIAFDVYKSRVRGPGGDVPTRLNRLTLVETATGKVIQQSDFENENRLEQITFSPAGNLVAVGGWVIRVWDVKTGKQIHRFDGHRGLITSLAFSPDGRRLVSTSGDTTALVWDVSN
jgi:dipeptidyl aminopeptidase/acylaminoacyl peptidase